MSEAEVLQVIGWFISCYVAGWCISISILTFQRFIQGI